MADITKSITRMDVSGVQNIPVIDSVSLHTVHIKGSTGDVTLTVVPKGFDVADARNPGADGENVIPENNMIQVEAGSLAFIVLTPTNTGAEYSVSVSSQ
ncbi:hypothetical protein [Thalassolituus sp.]|uniref:hypothetical protein n=1 Tax=Thalassolituus sp. TaxID=2030822 RepID=UPI002605F4D2|nr:hypothetical protein [Thalassolituus sp.]